VSFRVAVEGPVAVAWRSVDALQTAVQSALLAATGDAGLACLAGIATGELLENALKYGDAAAPAGEVRVEVDADAEALRLAVSSPADAAGADRVEEVIAALAAAASPVDAYQARMIAIASGEAKGGLGLLRVAAECGCSLSAERRDGALIVTAVMRVGGGLPPAPRG
jgi:hypothetical protein